MQHWNIINGQTKDRRLCVVDGVWSLEVSHVLIFGSAGV